MGIASTLFGQRFPDYKDLIEQRCASGGAKLLSKFCFRHLNESTKVLFAGCIDKEFIARRAGEVLAIRIVRDRVSGWRVAQRARLFNYHNSP